jgi:hypothetical protein
VRDPFGCRRVAGGRAGDCGLGDFDGRGAIECDVAYLASAAPTALLFIEVRLAFFALAGVFGALGHRFCSIGGGEAAGCEGLVHDVRTRDAGGTIRRTAVALRDRRFGGGRRLVGARRRTPFAGRGRRGLGQFGCGDPRLESTAGGFPSAGCRVGHAEFGLSAAGGFGAGGAADYLGGAEIDFAAPLFHRTLAALARR